jgi:hypothetical protein
MSVFAPIALSTPVLTSPMATVPARTRPVPETATVGAGAAFTTGLAGGVWTGVSVVFCAGASALAAAASPWALVELALSTARPRPPGMGDFFGGAVASDFAGGVWAAGAGAGAPPPSSAFGRRAKNHRPAKPTTSTSTIWKGRETCSIGTAFGRRGQKA